MTYQRYPAARRRRIVRYYRETFGTRAKTVIEKRHGNCHVYVRLSDGRWEFLADIEECEQRENLWRWPSLVARAQAG